MLTKRSFSIYSFFVLLFSLALAVWRVSLISRQIENGNGFASVKPAIYEAYGKWSVLFWVVIGLCVLASFFTVKLTFKGKGIEKSKPEIIFSAVTGLFFILFGLPLLVSSLRTMFFFSDFSLFSSVTMFSCVLMILSGLYYLLSAFCAPEKRTALTGLSFCPVLWTVLMIALSYFNASYSLGNPFRVTSDFAFIGVMFFFLMEAKENVREPLPDLYPVILLFSSSLSLLYILPQAVTVFSWFLKENPVPLLQELTILPIPFFSIYRLFQSIRGWEIKKPKEKA